MSETIIRRGRKPRLAPVEAAEDFAPAVEAREDTKEAVAPSRRRKRADTGGFRLKLKADDRKGFVRRWANDDGNRLTELQDDLAYDFVLDDKGQKIARYVGKKSNGEPLHAYLMETREEDYQVGVEEKAERTRAVFEAIHNRQDAGDQFRPGETYSPRGQESSVKFGRR